MTDLGGLLLPRILGEVYQRVVPGKNWYNSHLTWRSQRADSRMSANLIVPFELEYMKRLQCIGWNSAAVITSDNSSILAGLISTISTKRKWRDEQVAINTPLTEALVTYIHVPEIYTQIVGRDISFTVGVYGNRINMVCVCVWINLAGNSGHNVVLSGHSR